MRASTPSTLKVVRQWPRQEIIFAVARQPNTSRLFFGGSDFTVWVIDLDHDKIEPKALGRHDSYVTSLASAGGHLISGGYDGKLIWWATASGSQVRSVAAHSKWIRCVRTSPAGTVVASVADDMVCRVWDVSSGRMIRELRGHVETTPHDFPSMLFACAFSPDGRWLATGDKIGHITIWDVESGRSATTVEAPAFYTWDPVQRRHSIGGIRALAFSPDGAALAVGGIGKISNIDHLDGKPRVELFDWRKGKAIGEFSGEGKGLVEHVAFGPHGNWLIAAGGYSDGFFLCCDLVARKVASQIKVPMYVHDFELGEACQRAYAVGHHKIALFEWK
jgi:WD40 repeat protein